MRFRSPLVLILLAAFASCRRPARTDWFDEQARAFGLSFVHVNGMSGRFHFHEIMGPGVALFDYDNDGDLDVFFVQGQGAAQLYRNDLVMHPDGTRQLSFTDVTTQSGIRTSEYGMGVATADFDRDGCVDLYLTNFGRNQFYRNNCDGTFTDVTAQTGTGDPGWSVSATFLDYDRDGWPDLFVGHYASYAIDRDTPCFSLSGRRDYCSPNAYRPEQSRLYHNNRDGTFTDVTQRAGLFGDFGPTLGVVADDFDGDGWIDLYVANDGRENQLWINQRDGTFRNAALLSGVARTFDGKAPGSMGVDAADLDGNGLDDLIVTTLTGEGMSLFANRGAGAFDDAGARSGVRAATLHSTGFGVHSIDVDNDGWLDLLVANGAVRTIDEQVLRGDPLPLRERPQLLRNVGGLRFDDVSEAAGVSFGQFDIGRGAAFGDVDNDGDTDVVVVNNNGPARLLMNNIGARNHWIGLCLTDGAHARIGTRRRRASPDGSYASSNDRRVVFGLGRDGLPQNVTIEWPDGHVEQFSHLPADRYTTLVESGSR